MLDVPAGVAGLVAECASCGSAIEIPGPERGFLEEAKGAMVDRAEWDFTDLAGPRQGKLTAPEHGGFIGTGSGNDSRPVPPPGQAAGVRETIPEVPSARRASIQRREGQDASGGQKELRPGAAWASSGTGERARLAPDPQESAGEARRATAGKAHGRGRFVMVAAVAVVAAGGGWMAREVIALQESADRAVAAVEQDRGRPLAGPEAHGAAALSRSAVVQSFAASGQVRPQELPREAVPVATAADSVAEAARPAVAAEPAGGQAGTPEARLAAMVAGEGEPAAHAKTVVDFLAAANWHDRLALSMAPERVRGFMESLYRTVPDGPIFPDRVEFLKTVPLEQRPGRNYHVYTAFFEGVAGPVPLTVEETDVGLRVESRTFLESRERLLEKFARNPDAPPQEFRVMLNRAHYFGDDVPDQEGKLCFRMLPPTSDPEFHAWIDRQSAVYRNHFTDPGRQAWDVALLLVVELKWVSDGAGKRWMEVSDVIAGNWHPDSLPGPPGPVQTGR